MAEPSKIILRHVVTEKSSHEENAVLSRYTFKVAGNANRISVKDAIEKHFGVTVTKVNVLNVKPKVKSDRTRRGKTGRKAGYKKAIVRLKAGESIDLV